jgi:hypothetical protein
MVPKNRAIITLRPKIKKEACRKKKAFLTQVFQKVADSTLLRRELSRNNKGDAMRSVDDVMGDIAAVKEIETGQVLYVTKEGQVKIGKVECGVPIGSYCVAAGPSVMTDLCYEGLSEGIGKLITR